MVAKKMLTTLLLAAATAAGSARAADLARSPMITAGEMARWCAEDNGTQQRTTCLVNVGALADALTILGEICPAHPPALQEAVNIFVRWLAKTPALTDIWWDPAAHAAFEATFPCRK